MSSQAPTQPLTHSHAPSGMGERTGRAKAGKIVGRDEDSLVGEEMVIISHDLPQAD